MASQDCQIIKDRLDKAEQALDDLMFGRSVKVLVDQNGERVEYTQASRSALQAYIARLRQQYAACSGTGSSTTGPLRFLF